MEAPRPHQGYELEENTNMSKYEITVNGERFVVEVGDVSSSPIQVVVNGQPKSVTFQAAGATSAPAAPAPVAAPVQVAAPAQVAEPEPEVVPVGAVEGEVVKAPMPGKILSIRVKAGDRIAAGDTVATLEAMKMEMPISSTASGTVQAVHVTVGTNVAHDDALVTIG
jgi:glutaconyl-CoA decarboxylase